MRATSSSGPAGVGAPATTSSADDELGAPALVQQRGGLRVVVDHELQQVQPPQRARKRLREATVTTAPRCRRCRARR